MKKTIFARLFLVTLLALTASIVTACDKKKPEPTKEKYTVIFDVNAGDDVVTNDPGTVRVDENTPVSKPKADPVRTGYNFDGWYTNEEGTGDEYNFSTLVTKNNFVLFAKWSKQIITHSVHLVIGESDETTVQVESGKKLSVPTEPTKDNHRFDGWFLDENYSSKFNFNTVISEDITLYAKWVLRISVTYKLNDGQTEDIISMFDINAEHSLIDTPTREGFTFGGWFTNSELTAAYEADILSTSIILYAKWIDNSVANKHNVQFNFNFTNTPESVTVEVTEGAVVTQPSIQREGYRLVGWFIDDQTFTQRFSLSTPIDKDYVLYAKWVEVVKLSLDYNYENSINPSDITVDVNNAITTPNTPSRVGYTFAGWSTESNGLVGFDFSKGILENTTLYAQWQKVHVFEAEYLDFSDFFGWGFSGNATGTDAIVEDVTGNAGVSNGRFVTYLYGNGITLEYEIYSDRAIDNVKFILRLSGEIKDFFIQSERTPNMLEEEPVYTIKVNDETIKYDSIYFIGVPSQSSNQLLPFEDYVISMNISLKEGLNTFTLITDNNLLMGGTMSATAPMIDCLKLETYAVLTWNPKLDNY